MWNFGCGSAEVQLLAELGTSWVPVSPGELWGTVTGYVVASACKQVSPGRRKAPAGPFLLRL